MKFRQILDRFTFIFFLLGQNCVSTVFVRPNGSEKDRIYRFPSIILLSLNTLLLCFVIFFLATFTNYHATDNLLVAILVLSLTATIFAASIQSLLFQQHFLVLFSQLVEVETLISPKLSLNFRIFIKSYLQEIVIIFVANSISSLVSIILKPLEWSDFVLNSTIHVFTAFTLITIFHVLFYVNLLTFFLKSSILHVANLIQQIENFKSLQITFQSQINFAKLLHFNLWQLSQHICAAFGWSLLLLPLQNFFNSVYCVYFAFTEILDPDTLAHSIRKIFN